jgi:hypothetical protein
VYANADRNMPDNRLLLDLDSDMHIDEVRTLVRELGTGDALILQEAVPGPEDTWLTGPDGQYFSELVVSMVRREPEPSSSIWRTGGRHSPVRLADRVFPPGTEWLTLQLYGPPTDENQLLAERVRPLAAELLAAGSIDQ